MRSTLPVQQQLMTLWAQLLQVNIFKDAAEIMVGFAKQIRSQGFDLKYLDIGGGLGIDYQHR